MQVLLKEDKFGEFQDLFNKEVENLQEKINSVDINDILKIMGFNA